MGQFTWSSCHTPEVMRACCEHKFGAFCNFQLTEPFKEDCLTWRNCWHVEVEVETVLTLVGQMRNEFLEKEVALHGHCLKCLGSIGNLREPLGTGWRKCDGEACSRTPWQRGHWRHESIGIDGRGSIGYSKVCRYRVWNQSKCQGF